MHFKFAAATALYFLSVVSAATHNITVGKNNKDDYEPRLWVALSGLSLGTNIHWYRVISLTNVQSGDTIRFSL